MKITVEIVEDKFSYDFDVAGETGHGDRPLSVHGLKLFTAIIEDCHRSWAYETNKQIKEIECMAYLETHPAFIEEYLKKEKARKVKI